MNLANLKDVLEIPRNTNDVHRHDFIDFEFSIGDIVKIEYIKFLTYIKFL